MNKKKIISLCLFLTLIFIILSVSTVSATYSNKTTNTLSDEKIQDVAITEKTNNNIIDEDNHNTLNTKKEENKYDMNKKLDKKDSNLSDDKNAIKSKITVGSTKSVYVGDQMSIYGKLSANGVDLAYQNITVSVDGKKYYLRTTKYGNYNFKITPTTIGTKIITSDYAGTGTYSSASASSTFTASKSTLITLGSTKNVFVDGNVKIYGKLMSKGKDYAYKTVTIDVDGKKYFLTTSKYGNYNMNITAKSEGYHTITASYTGTNTYTSDTNSTYYYASKKTSLLTLGSTKNVYIGDQISVYGKLTANGKNLANQKITIKVDGTYYTLTTSQYGNYNIKLTANNEGYNTISASYSGTNAIRSDTNSTYYYGNKKNSDITLGSSKNVYVGAKVCIYGKLTANGKNLANQKVTINIDNERYYTVTTTKYGNYNLNITATSEGYHDIYATYYGSNAIRSDSNYTYFHASKQDTLLTIGSAETVIRGKPFSVYGKLTANGKGLAYKEVEIEVGGNIYTVMTSKYGNYKINATDGGHGQKGIGAIFYGDAYYHNSSANHGIFVQDPSLELYTYQIKNGYPQSTKQVEGDLFLAWYQTYDAQYDKGVHIEVIGYNPRTDTYSEPHHGIIRSYFYFKDRNGNIIMDSYEEGDDYYRYHSLMPGYTPYKILITYYEIEEYYYDDVIYY